MHRSSVRWTTRRQLRAFVAPAPTPGDVPASGSESEPARGPAARPWFTKPQWLRIGAGVSLALLLWAFVDVRIAIAFMFGFAVDWLLARDYR